MAAVLGFVSRMRRNAQGVPWGMSDTTWNGYHVQVLDTTKEGLLVHVDEGTPGQGDEQAGRMLEVPRGLFWALGLEGTAPAHIEDIAPPPAGASQGKTAKWAADMSSKRERVIVLLFLKTILRVFFDVPLTVTFTPYRQTAGIQGEDIGIVFDL